MGNFKRKFGKRILAYILSGAMILSSMTGSNMTAFASEAPKDTGEAYYEEAADSNTTASEAAEDEKEEASKNDENASGESEAAKTTETAKAETTETETAKSETTEAETKETQTTKEETTETETTKDEQTSETESSSVAETETETESDSETSEAVETESKEADEDLKADATIEGWTSIGAIAVEAEKQTNGSVLLTSAATKKMGSDNASTSMLAFGEATDKDITISATIGINSVTEDNFCGIGIGVAKKDDLKTTTYIAYRGKKNVRAVSYVNKNSEDQYATSGLIDPADASKEYKLKVVKAGTKITCYVDDGTEYNKAYTIGTASNTLIGATDALYPVIILDGITVNVSNLAVEVNGEKVYDMNATENTPGGDQEKQYVEAGKIDFTKTNIADGVKGVSVENVVDSGSGHGLQTKAADATIKLNLSGNADITVESCRYGAGANGTADMKSSSGKVTTGTVAEGDATAPVYTVTGAKGETTLTFASNMYIHNIVVEYKAECVEAGKIDFTKTNIADGVKGVSVENVVDSGSGHGLQTKAADAKIILNLSEKAEITVESCRYGAGANGTADMKSSSGKVTAGTVAEGDATAPVYTVTGAEGETTLTYASNMYIHSIEVKYVDGGGDTPAGVTGKNKDGKPDVWDFAAGAVELDSNGMPTKYIQEVQDVNNMLTEDIMNTWNINSTVQPGQSGGAIGSFAVKNDDGKILMEFNGNSKTNNRLRTKNKKITRHDEKSLKDADGNEYLGYIYSNSASTDAVYLGLALEEGDIVTAVVGSNGGDSTIKFEALDGEGDAQTYEYVTGNAGIATFYATHDAEYKMYSTNEKLVVARVTVEKTDYVKVSGKVNAPESLTKDYSIVFTCKETGAEKSAKVTNGAYSIDLNERYTYEVSLGDANGYIIKNDPASFTLDSNTVKVENDQKTFTYDINVEAVQLATVTGKITGFAAVAGGVAEPLKNLKLTFESDNIYVPELTVSETGDFTLVLESGVEYAVVAEGVDDFTLKTEKISATADGTQDIVFEAKPVYNITVTPEGITKEDLAPISLIFSRVHEKDDVKEYEEDYVYTFTGTEGIVLRDGQYEVTVGLECLYTQKVTSDLKVEGADTEKVIKFDPNPRTEWDFRLDDYPKTNPTSYRGLTIVGGKKHGSQYGMMIGCIKDATGAVAELGHISVPVTGPSTITVSVGYNWDIGMEGSETRYTDKTNSGDIDVTFEYTGEAGKAVLFVGSDFTSYIKKIKVDAKADKTEYEAKVTVGAKGCDYTSINDALDAVRKMERTDNQRVTIEIQPGDYEEMLVIDTPNVTLRNANANPSITPVNKGVDIKASSVRITSYYGHGYAYYSMGEDCKWNADILEANKENGYMSFTNPGTGTTSGSYWNATVVIGADGFEADGIIFENSFNQYVSKKAADDVIVPLSGAKGENVAPRNSLKAGDTSVQYKDYVERAAALAIMDAYKNINFNNCSFIGRQDTLYGGTGVTAAFYDCDVYGGTDYIFGGMTAVFAKCDLVFNTNDQTDNGVKNDVGYITAAQQKSGRGYLMYNCTVTSTIPGVNSASEKMSKPGQFGRPWQANTGEALFYRTIIEKTNYSGKEESLIQAVGWNSGLGGESKLSQEYASIELAGVDNSDKRVGWAQVLKAVDGKVTLADGNTVVTDDTVVAAFLGDWNPFAGKDMSIAETTPSEVVNNIPKETGLYVRFVDEWGAPASAAELDRLCAYAAGPVEPNIEVYNDGEYLIPDVDYTVRYRNNVNVGNAAVIVTGKGNYAGSTSEIPFTINKRDIADEEVYIPRDMTVVVNTKVTPVIVHNNKNLSSKSYTISGSGLTNGKYTRVTTGDNYNTLTIKGTGNYTGEVEVNVRVVDRKNAKSLKVAVDKNCKFTYGDNPDVDELVDKGLIKVTDSKSAKKLVLGENFDVVCSDTGKVGTVKFTVVGIGEYTGSVTKSFKVTPLKVTDSKKFDITYDAQAQYNDKGATVQNLTVVYTGLDEELTLGRDYKVSYKNNRKLGKAAKLTISFLGNYKGSSAITKDFEVVPAAFEYVTVIAPNKVYTKAGGSYKSVPVVKVDGATLKASNYTVSYEWKSGSQETYKKDDRVKVTLAKGDDNAEVRMTIKLKNNNYRFTEDQGVGYYDVTRAAADAEDISKAKVQFVGRNGNLLTYLNYIGMEYYSPENGAASNDRNAVYVRLMSAKTGKVIDPNLYYVEWVNATEKGTATVIINAKDGAVGSRTAKISIKAVPVSDISLSTNTTSLGGTVKLLEKYFNEL